MLHDIKRIIERSPRIFLQDAVGASALMLAVFAGLHLPGFT